MLTAWLAFLNANPAAPNNAPPMAVNARTVPMGNAATPAKSQKLRR
jgi:hypothetical protein